MNPLRVFMSRLLPSLPLTCALPRPITRSKARACCLIVAHLPGPWQGKIRHQRITRRPRDKTQTYRPCDLTAANFSVQRILPVICMTTNRVTMAPTVMDNPV